jgi:hypothetical protein
VVPRGRRLVVSRNKRLGGVQRWEAGWCTELGGWVVPRNKRLGGAQSWEAGWCPEIRGWVVPRGGRLGGAPRWEDRCSLYMPQMLKLVRGCVTTAQ